MLPLALFPTATEAASIKVTWDPIDDPNLSSYKVYYSTISGYYTAVVKTGKTAEMTVTNVSAGSSYFFVVSYSTLAGFESPCSPEAKCVIPSPSISGGTTTTSTTTTTTVKAYTGAPQMSWIPNVSIPEDRAFWSYPFTILDADTPVESLLVSVRSANLDLVPTNNITITGTGSNRVVTIRPVTNSFGSAYLSIFATDGKNTNGRSFTLTVDPVNDLPITTGLPAAIRVTPGTDSLAYPYTITDVETVPRNLRTWATSGNQAVVPDQNLIIGGSEGSRTLTVIAPSDSLGITQVRVAVADEVSTNWTTVEVSVSPPNTPPQLILSADLTAIVDIPFLMSAVVFDDGLPLRPGKVTLTWSQVSGPASLGASKSLTNYSVLFSTPGAYAFRCVASDGDYAISQDLLVNVLAQSLAAHLPTSPPPASTNDNFEIYQFRILDLSSDSLNVAWQTTQPALADFEYSAKSSDIWNQIPCTSDPTYLHSALASALTPNSEYLIRARATTPAGLSVTSAPVSIRTIRTLLSYEPIPLDRAELLGNMTAGNQDGAPTIHVGESGECNAHLRFDIPQTGTYFIWLRIEAGLLSTVPYAVAVDQSIMGIFSSPEAENGTRVGWSKATSLALLGEPQALELHLTRGTHTLDLIGLEYNTTLSFALITSDPTYIADDFTPVAGIVPASKLPGPLYFSQLPNGWSLIGNPLQGAAALASFNLYQPEAGTTLQTFPDSFTSAEISIYDGMQWSGPADLKWTQAGAVYNPSEQPMSFALIGSVDAFTLLPALYEGEQLLVMPTPAGGTLESLLNIGFAAGDTFTFLDSTSGTYQTCTYDGNAWDRIPVLSVGEAAILTLMPRDN